MYVSILLATVEIKHTDANAIKRVDLAFRTGRLAQELGLTWPDPLPLLSPPSKQAFQDMIKKLSRPVELGPQIFGSSERTGDTKLLWKIAARWNDPTQFLSACERAGFSAIGNWLALADYISDESAELVRPH